MSDPKLPEETSNPFAAPQANVRDRHESGIPELATLGQRFGGSMIDQLLLMAAILIVAISTGDFETLASMSEQDTLYFEPGMLSDSTIMGFAIVMFAYMGIQVYLVVTAGQTIGKRVVGSRVHRTSGERVHPVRHLLIRGFLPTLLYYIPGAGPLLTVLTHLTIFGARRKCFHDYLADTVVLQA